MWFLSATVIVHVTMSTGGGGEAKLASSPDPGIWYLVHQSKRAGQV